MKIIISRKGFDNANGKCASPILPDGDMVSMPIRRRKAAVSNLRKSFIRDGLMPKCGKN